MIYMCEWSSYTPVFSAQLVIADQSAAADVRPNVVRVC